MDHYTTTIPRGPVALPNYLLDPQSIKVSDDELKFMQNNTLFNIQTFNQYLDSFNQFGRPDLNRESEYRSPSDTSLSESHQSSDSMADPYSSFNSPRTLYDDHHHHSVFSSPSQVANVKSDSQTSSASAAAPKFRGGLDLIPMRACCPPDNNASFSPDYNVKNFTTNNVPVTFDSSFLYERAGTKLSSAESSSISSPLTNLNSAYPSSDIIPIMPQGLNLDFSDDDMDISKRRSMNQKFSRNVSKVCPICNKTITRDLSRHLRIHEPVSRFRCIFPKDTCSHKTGQFNRPYDYKKHLLNAHFVFDDPVAKKLHNLNEKLHYRGTCLCGMKFTAIEWLDSHILEPNCAYLLHLNFPIADEL